MNIDSLEKLYAHELKDLYSAENQILDALPRMIDKATDDGLREALTKHHEQTKEHIDRIKTIFKSLDFEPGGHRCRGIAGLLEEATDNLQHAEPGVVMDAAIISSCQRVEHYEIAAYGVARAFAEKLGRTDDADLLTHTLEQEGDQDRWMTQLAERRINALARVG